MSPLAEGRELKWLLPVPMSMYIASPLAEGRELKWNVARLGGQTNLSPLAEGRELKFAAAPKTRSRASRPSRRGVN